MFLIFPFQVMNLIGDVKGKVAVIVDDMINIVGTKFPFKNKYDWKWTLLDIQGLGQFAAKNKL
ncbi:putative ribose-phosphate diphosphokinase [Helianthus annuus]|nr:putative ribose-phosphate diphosphokinase [Helianthus annuus]